MTTTDQPGRRPLEEPLDEQRLMSFVFRAVDEVGATLNAALVVLGDKLGWYEALAERGPMTAEALADAAGTALPYTREWLNAQAAGSFVDYDPTTGRYTLPPEHAVALTDADSPAYLPGLFQIALGTVADSQRLVDVVRRGRGIGWVDAHLLTAAHAATIPIWNHDRRLRACAARFGLTPPSRRCTAATIATPKASRRDRCWWSAGGTRGSRSPRSWPPPARSTCRSPPPIRCCPSGWPAAICSGG